MDDAAKAKPGSSTGPGTAQRARMQLQAPNQTPRAVRTHIISPPSCLTGHREKVRTLSRVTAPTGSPSPQKTGPVFGTFGRPPARIASPSKPGPSSNTTVPRPTKPPSSATFNPVLPPKTPHYPNPRLPRLNENMLSLNGSPLSNPYGVDAGWFTADEAEDGASRGDDETGHRKKKKGKESRLGLGEVGRPNSIFIRRDPSFTPTTNGIHSHIHSQANIAVSSTKNSRTDPSDSYTLHPNTPKPPSRTNSHTTLPPAALVAIPTKDGHLLEFDPLQTSPGALDALEGITASAKKQAKEDVGRLVQAAVDKWKVK